MLNTRPHVEYKEILLDIKSLDDSNGGFKGYASTFGNVDRVNDIMLPGAFSATISDFLKDGSICWNHDQDEQIGYPTAAQEDATGLWIETAYHSTDFAQEKRTIVNERLAAGMTVKLSVGYVADDFNYNADGVRLLNAVTLFEVSIVTVPANNEAGIVDGKSIETALDHNAGAISDDTTGATQKALAAEIANRFLALRMRRCGVA